MPVSVRNVCRVRWLVFGITLLLSGCGGQGHDRTEVTGLLTLDDKPLPSGLTVKFTPDNPDTPIAVGSTDSESRYTVYAEQGKIGLSPGRYTVSVELPFADQPGPYTGPPSLANVTIPDRFQTGKSSLTFEAPRDGHRLDIPMTTKD